MTPLEHFEGVWKRCDLMSRLHAYLQRNVSSVLQPDELLRSEWVARVSALDLYVHELIAQSLVAIFEGRRAISPAYLRFQVPIETVHRLMAAPSNAEASVAFDLYVRSQLARATYQFPDDIADGVRLCSTIELWNEMALRLGATPSTKADQAQDLKRQLSIIVRRRNLIAHEGDLQRIPPREPLPISIADLAEVSKVVEKIVRTIDIVA